MAEAFGAWGVKKNYGREYLGIIRSTFVANAAGVLEHAWYNVRAKAHVDRVAREVLVE
jgi:peroxiredoxin Q/BCP